MNGVRSGAAGTWLLGGIAAACIAIMFGLLAFTLGAGLVSLWPAQVERIELRDGAVLLGEVVASDATSLVLRGSEDERIGEGYRRLHRADIIGRDVPVDALVLQFGDGRRRFAVGETTTELAQEQTAAEVMRPNAMSLVDRTVVFLRHLFAFVMTSPDASNLSGGVLPALVGTVTLVLLMSVLVLPFGIATAVYLHQRRGPGMRIVRAAIDTLAGVPAIVYGVLGLGLFVHGVGGSLDRWFYADRLPVPTFGSGGLLWAALTLALLTLPVVVVSVEQGLARIPAGLRAGSLALGATREETLWHLLLPAARPAVLTGLILAISRAAGSVAPLMLVGMVKLAPASPLDGAFPYLHPSRQFMHLGFAVYDAALASPDAIRGVPRAYACAMLLVFVVIALNLSAILLRNRLRDRYRALES